MSYCFLVISNLALRLTGVKWMAYLAQVLTGISAALINTTFESWVNYESTMVFGDKLDEKERFLKKIFKSQTLFDALVCVAASMNSAIFYNLYGITAPIIISMILATCALIAINFLWDENRPGRDSQTNFYQSMIGAIKELKKKEVFSLGIIESLFLGVLSIFIFAWTPILQLSTPLREMNLGAVSLCFVSMVIISNILFEIFIVNLSINPFLALFIAFFLECICFYIVYTIDSFFIRLIFLSAINGSSGFLFPLNSIIKSQILKEKYRALLMNIFRMPLNLYVVAVLLAVQFIDPMTICIICSVMLLVAALVALSMQISPPAIIRRQLTVAEEIEEIVEENTELEEEKENVI